MFKSIILLKMKIHDHGLSPLLMQNSLFKTHFSSSNGFYTLRKHAHAIYSNFHGCKNDNLHMKKFDIFLIFAQNIDCGYMLDVLTSTHNQCFRAKIRKNVYPCKPQFYYIKVGCKGVYITRTCYHDGGADFE